MKTTIAFLKKLKKNNSTEWMHSHKEEYLAAKREFEFLVQELITRIGQWDPRLPYLEPKSCIFRLNRDVRFSENKSPYKENFGAFFAYGGKKGGMPGYYLHVSPQEVFAAAGLWMPEPERLLKIRRHISGEGGRLKKALKGRGLDPEQVLKRVPKGFSPDDEFAEFLKFKSFTLSQDIPVKEAVAPGFGKVVEKTFKGMKPLNDFLWEGLSYTTPIT